MKRKILIILAVIAIIAVAAFLYIDNIFLPVQFKQFITTRAHQLLQREISIGSIDFKPIKGFVFENITVSRKDDPNRPFIQVKEISFNLLLAPLFQKQAMILPHVRIKDPYVYLVRDETRAWNFADLLGLRRQIRRRRTFSVLLRALSIENGQIDYTDHTLDETFTETITGLDLNITLSLNKGIRFILDASTPGFGSALTVKGNYSLMTRKVTAQILGENIPLAKYLPLSHTSTPYIDLADGVISSVDLRITYDDNRLKAKGAFAIDQADLNIGETRHISGSIYVPEILLAWRDKKWNAKGKLELPAVQASDGPKKFSGNLKADLNLLTIFENNITSQGNVTINDAYISLDENRHFSGHITAQNASVVKGDGKVHLQGDFNTENSLLVYDDQISLSGDIETEKTSFVWLVDKDRAHTLNVKTGLALNDAKLVLNEQRSVTGDLNAHTAEFTFTSGKTTVRTSGQLAKARLQMDHRSFAGDPSFSIYYEHDPGHDPPVDYRSTLSFSGGRIDGLPTVKEASGITGTVGLMPDHIQTGGLAFTSQATDILLSGLVADLNKPDADIRLSSKNVVIENLLSLFPSIEETTGVKLTGQASVQAHYIGLLDQPGKAEIESTVDLVEGTVDHYRLNDVITGLSARFVYRNDLLEWRNLKGTYFGRIYALTGKLEDFSRPSITTTLTGDNLSLSADMKLLNNAFQFKSLAGKYFNTSFDLKGDGHLFDDEDADIDLRGTVELDLSDIGRLIPRLERRAEQFAPAGILNAEGIFKGKLADWRNWQMVIDGQSDGILLKGHPFKDVILRFTQRDQTINKCNVSAKLYGGTLDVTSSADLRDEAIPFTAATDLKDLDLAEFRKANKTKNRSLAGLLTFTAAVEGQGKHWRDMAGGGSIDITEGHLWQWDKLSNLSKALLIPEFKNLVFTEGHASFTVKNQKISTNDLQLLSRLASLKGKGWIDLKTNLNFDLTPHFSEIAIIQSGSIKKGPTSVITQTDGYLTIKVGGTLAKPKFRVDKNPMKIFEGTVGNTTNTITGVIGGIVDELLK